MDKFGILWLGTVNGLSSFDGITTKVFINDSDDSNSIISNFITNIIEDKNGNLWIGTEQGFTMYDRTFHKFHNYSKLKTEVNIPKNFYTFPFYIDAYNNIWAYIAGEIMIIDYTRRTARSIGKFGNGRVYHNKPFYKILDTFYTNNLYGFNQVIYNKKTLKYESNGFLQGENLHPFLEVNNMLVDLGQVWIATNNGLKVLNTKNNNISSVHFIKKDIPIKHVGILPTNNNFLIIATEKDGVYIINKFTLNIINHFRHNPLDQNSILDNSVEMSLVDNKGNLFLVHPFKGLSYGNMQSNWLQKHLYYSYSDGLEIDPNINNIKSIKDSLISIGTKRDGLIIYNIDKKLILKQLHKNKGIMWQVKFGTKLLYFVKEDGIYFIDPNDNHLQSIKIKTTTNILNKSIHNDAIIFRDKLLISTNVGLWQVNEDEMAFSVRKISSIDTQVEWNHIQKIIPIDSQNFLLQTFYTNIYKVKYEKKYLTVEKEICRSPFFTTGYHDYQDKILLATSNGIYSYEKKNETLAPYALYQFYCQGIIPKVNDPNKFWIPTTNGLLLWHIGNKKTNRYEFIDGLSHNTFNTNSWVNINNNILLGTIKGITSFYDNISPQESKNVTPLVNEILVNDRNDEQIINPIIVRKISLPHYKNTISIGISPLTYSNAKEKKLSYRLYPYERKFVTVTGRQLIKYPRLPSGNYSFQVYDEEFKNLRSIAVYISPPFWTEWWFVGIMIAITLAIIYSIVRWNVHNARKQQLSKWGLMIQSQEEERKRIANDLHDDFGARLSTLKMYLHLMKRQEKGEAKETTDIATQMLDDTISDLRNILLNLSPKTLQENGLKSAIHELSNNVRRLTSIAVHEDLEAHNQTFTKNMEHSIFRILQELMNNTIKHSQAKNIHLSIVDYVEYCTLLYEDDGLGFDIEQCKKGFGWNNLMMHAKLIDAIILIDSAPGKGIAVTLTIPIDLQNKGKVK